MLHGHTQSFLNIFFQLKRWKKYIQRKYIFLTIDKEEKGVSSCKFRGDSTILESITQGIVLISLMVGYGLLQDSY